MAAAVNPVSNVNADTQPLTMPKQRRPLRWRTRLARLLLGTLLLVSVVLLATPTPAEPQPGYRIEVTRAHTPDAPLPEQLAARTVQVTAWAAGQANDRQADLLQTSPVDTRLFTPASRWLGNLISTHRLLVLIVLGLITAGLVFYGVYRRPAHRWWLTTVLLLLISSGMVNFPQATLTAANTPGLAVTRQVANWAHTGLFNPDARQAATVQADLAERFWTGFVTGTHSRLQTQSNILTHTPAANRDDVVAFLHRQGVQPASGQTGAVISASGLLSAAPFALGIAGASVLGSTAQTLLLLLTVSGLLAVPGLLSTGRLRVLLTWWMVPATLAMLLAAVAAFASLGLTALAVAAASTWETISSVIAGSVLALLTLGTLVAVGWRVRRRVRAWIRGRRERPARPMLHRARSDRNDTQPQAAVDAAGRGRKAGAA